MSMLSDVTRELTYLKKIMIADANGSSLMYFIQYILFLYLFPPPLLNSLIGLDKTNLPTALLRSKSGEQIL